jgi:GAF domain-containing protein
LGITFVLVRKKKEAPLLENVLIEDYAAEGKALSKQEQYATLLPQVAALLHGEPNLMANAANMVAALKQAFNFFWVGFYFVDADELVLGPFQGPVACTRIRFGKGVCGAAWQQAKTIVVPNVDEFPGHIACSSASKSEIVVPVFVGSKVVAVLDVDSDKLNDFDSTDAEYMEKTVQLLTTSFAAVE